MKDDYVYPRGNAPGMELRDWFAGMAMQGLVARMSEKEFRDDWDFGNVTSDALNIANMMMKKRIETND